MTQHDRNKIIQTLSSKFYYSLEFLDKHDTKILNEILKNTEANNSNDKQCNDCRKAH